VCLDHTQGLGEAIGVRLLSGVSIVVLYAVKLCCTLPLVGAIQRNGLVLGYSMEGIIERFNIVSSGAVQFLAELRSRFYDIEDGRTWSEQEAVEHIKKLPQPQWQHLVNYRGLEWGGLLAATGASLHGALRPQVGAVRMHAVMLLEITSISHKWQLEMQGPGSCGDHNSLCRTANVLTSLPYVWLGVKCFRCAVLLFGATMARTSLKALKDPYVSFVNSRQPPLCTSCM